MNDNKAVLVIGAGVAGMEASLTLATAGKKVYLVEKDTYLGGNVIKYEEVFSNMECATCMIAPKQQEVLQHENIELLTLSEVQEIQGSYGDFRVRIRKKARYVSLEDCIGCAACFEVCPVSVRNEFEEELGERKAIYVPCAGALPNVPRINTQNCLRWKGEECQACQEACMFEAIDFDQKDEELEVKVEAVILATGFAPLDPRRIPKYGYGLDDVYTALEFERMYASNGPTGGKIILKDGSSPKRATVIYGVGMKDFSCPASICTMYSLKFIHYLKDKIPDLEITEFYRELCVPCKSCQKFYEKMRETGAVLIRAEDIEVRQKNGEKVITYKTEAEKEESIVSDMVIIATPIRPRDDASGVSRIFGVAQSKDGFFAKEETEISSVTTSKKGIFIAGCAAGPKDIQESIAQSQAAAGRVLSLSP